MLFFQTAANEFIQWRDRRIGNRIKHLRPPFPAGEQSSVSERDRGLAFAVVLVLIAMLMVGWFRSYVTPLVVMAAIPFSLIGILPAHWAMGAFLPLPR